mgnify:FL=1
MPKEISNEFKNSFAPISNNETQILILGSLPGEKSLQMAEYYAHPQNRFWRVLAKLTNSPLPIDYGEKIDLLLKNNLGVWDVVKTAKRIGSLDTNILDEVPNDLEGFIEDHPNLEVIVFNGSKSQKLFDKYFIREPNLKYLELPSTSPANATYNFERLCERWLQIVR